MSSMTTVSKGQSKKSMKDRSSVQETLYDRMPGHVDYLIQELARDFLEFSV